MCTPNSLMTVNSQGQEQINALAVNAGFPQSVKNKKTVIKGMSTYYALQWNFGYHFYIFVRMTIKSKVAERLDASLGTKV